MAPFRRSDATRIGQLLNGAMATGWARVRCPGPVGPDVPGHSFHASAAADCWFWPEGQIG